MPEIIRKTSAGAFDSGVGLLILRPSNGAGRVQERLNSPIGTGPLRRETGQPDSSQHYDAKRG
jgi:hypothetical protein